MYTIFRYAEDISDFSLFLGFTLGAIFVTIGSMVHALELVKMLQNQWMSLYVKNAPNRIKMWKKKNFIVFVNNLMMIRSKLKKRKKENHIKL